MTVRFTGMAKGNIKNFRKIVWRHYRAHGRHDLPWRPPSLKLRKGKKDDILYRVLVSEVMLQQTQVERVIPFYKKFIKKFPTAERLASARLSSVLQAWQGLGYNRRAKHLREAALSVHHILSYSEKYGASGITKELEQLPGVGPYTARAVAAFAYNKNVVFVETNIRTAVIHHFFSRRSDVEDTELVEVLRKALPKGKAGKWYSALMDYGAHLKRSGISHNVKSKKYAKQSTFAGSLREARGAIMRALAKGPQVGRRLTGILGDGRIAQMHSALADLARERLVARKRGRYTLADY